MDQPTSSTETETQTQTRPKLKSLDTGLRHDHTEDAPSPTDLWGGPLGLPPRKCNDDIVRVYRLAVGIAHIHPSDVDVGKLEEGCGLVHSLPPLKERRKKATGLYQLTLKAQWRKDRLHGVLDITMYALYIIQVVVGAALTALGPSAGGHPAAITVLGAGNTVIAALLALIRGQSLPERFRKDEMEFRKVRDFIEETEAMLLAGIIGEDQADVGRLVGIAFKMYNSAKENEENNRPGSYVRRDMPGGGKGSH